MRHLAQQIGFDLSRYWKIKFDQNKCANMFNSDWVSCGDKIMFHLYADTPYDVLNGSIILQAHRYWVEPSYFPRIRLVLDNKRTGIDHAIVNGYIRPGIIPGKDILKKIIEIHKLSYRDIVVFGRKLNLLNVSII